VLFNSFQFLLFYLVVVAIFFALPQRFRWVLLLLASYYFYMSWKAEYVVLIMAATLINYGVGIGLEHTERPEARKALLATGIGASLSILFGFKYLDFFSASVENALAAVNIFREMPLFELILPLGISFYTFQAVGYAIDVYRGETPAEHHLGIFALYVSFFPQLVAGPIERSYQLLPQFKRTRRFDADRVVSGLQSILWGLVKKVVIADNIAIVVDTIYARPDAYSGPYLVLATVFFSVQIYCDFSGYSDMAIGTARIMGYDLMTNFRRPYFATSVADFWRRWHISLSTWFRDYVYKPLGGNRVRRPRWVSNILVVFILSGIWHGANWTFIAWGAIHGVTMVIGAFTAGLRARITGVIGLDAWPRVHRALQIAIVTSITVTAWVFFRAESIEQAVSIVLRFTDLKGANLYTLWTLGLPRFEIAVAFAMIGLLFAVELCQEYALPAIDQIWASRPVRWACYAIMFYAIVFFGVFGQIEFIYFQF